MTKSYREAERISEVKALERKIHGGKENGKETEMDECFPGLELF